MSVRRNIVMAVVGVCIGTAGAVPAQAQLSPPQSGGATGVVGTGVVTLERQPELLRLQLQLTADGKDAKEALAKLKAKESAARSKLQQIGATESSIQFSDPQPQDANQRQQMEQMIQMRMNGRPQKPAKNQPPAVTITTTLKAEWPLNAKDGDALLLESQEIESKVKAADLSADPAGGEKPADKTAALEQEEVAEEAQAMAMMNNGQANPREPAFAFVSRISEADRDKARAEAFQKARADAARLAKAASSDLGSIRLLTGTAAPAPNTPTDPMSQMYELQQRFLSTLTNRPEGDDTGEAISPQPGKVAYRVTVYVAFDLK